MARRKRTDPEPTLFPFLSVLAAVMGTLILVIAGMTQIALASPRPRIEVEAFSPEKKSPVYVECTREGLLIHPDDPTQGEPERVDRFDIGDADGAYRALLTRLERDPRRYLLLLVRPDGVGSFNAARTETGGRGIDVGYEPLFGTGTVRFRKSEAR
jgi:hypothetical protein